VTHCGPCRPGLRHHRRRWWVTTGTQSVRIRLGRLAQLHSLAGPGRAPMLVSHGRGHAPRACRKGPQGDVGYTAATLACRS
jgi:hypothetical protein